MCSFGHRGLERVFETARARRCTTQNRRRGHEQKILVFTVPHPSIIMGSTR